MLVILSLLCSGLGLKLLENTDPAPTKPYKAVGPNKESKCKIMETWDVLKHQKIASAVAGQEGVVVAPSPDTACAKALPPAQKAWAKVMISSASEADKMKATKAYAVVLDRCCQSPTDSMTDGTAEVYKGFKNVGFGKARLPGVSQNCKGWSMTAGTDTIAADTIPTPKFYTTLPTWATDTSVSSDLYSAYHTKITSVVPAAGKGVITLKAGTVKTDYDAVCGTTGSYAAANSLACLKKQREVCMKGSVWETATGSAELNPYKFVCGGFCRNYTTSNATFYMTNYCYLDVSGDPSGSKSICYSSKATSPTKAQMPQAFNDPKVVNMAGEQFEILASGTFAMLDVNRFEESSLKILATIDRAGSRCGATYIQNVSLSGSWVKHLGVTDIHIQAASAVPKNVALQVSTDQGKSWQGSAQWNAMQNISFTRKLQIKLNSVEVEVSVDAHRIVEGERKTRRFANFLNLNVRGVHALSGDYSIAGLLGSDDHKSVAVTPKGCNEGEMTLNLKQLSSARLNEPDEEETDFGVVEDPVDSCALEDCGSTVPEE